MEEKQFDTLMLAMSGLNAKVDGLRQELKSDILGLRVELKTDIAELRQEIADVRTEMRTGFHELREQVAATHVLVVDHERRIRTLEGPGA